MSTFPAQRVAVLVDIQNMFYSAKTTFNGKLNYKKLLHGCVNDRHLIRSIAYVIQRPDVDQDSFLECLRKFGFELFIKATKNRKDSHTGKMIPSKGSIELNLAVDAIVLADRVDTIIIASGDGVYLPLVNALKSKGVRVEVLGFKGSTAYDLIQAASIFREIPESWIVPYNSREYDEEEHEEEEYEEDEEADFDEEYDDVDEEDLDDEEEYGDK